MTYKTGGPEKILILNWIFPTFFVSFIILRLYLDFLATRCLIKDVFFKYSFFYFPFYSAPSVTATSYNINPSPEVAPNNLEVWEWQCWFNTTAHGSVDLMPQPMVVNTTAKSGVDYNSFCTINCTLSTATKTDCDCDAHSWKS